MKKGTRINFQNLLRKYALHWVLKSFFLFFISCNFAQNEIQLIPAGTNKVEITKDKFIKGLHVKMGAERISSYLPLIDNQREVGIVANQTSRIGKTHLVDTLLSLGIYVNTVFAPEHGFRGHADAGEHVASGRDEKTGLPIVSLYGKNKKPTKEQLSALDVVIFDIQDVGARFYTYISTLHYILEACAAENIPVIVLDRPNPNGHYVDGPVLKKGFTSFVGMHPIPIVHGMTIGEYAKMINGEGWLADGLVANLSVIEMENYDRFRPYKLPVAPSPNLRSPKAIALYPSLCLFEGTIISEGRGTEKPFEIFGHPDLPPNKYTYTFTPISMPGAKNPKFLNQLCYGLDLNDSVSRVLSEVQIDWLIDAYKDLNKRSDFFITKNRWFDILAGTDQLRKDIEAGKTAAEIKDSWQEDLEKFELIRNKYLIYK
jgi:uncharacterized protein YbbC (DUF1343 family)